jgi:hypothetical protein
MTPASQPARRERGGRVLWRACGILVCAALGASALNYARLQWVAPYPERFVTVTKTVTVAQPVSSLTVQLSAPVQVIARPGNGVQVTSTDIYAPRSGGAPVLTRATSGGRLTLSCADGSSCGVGGVMVIVPPDAAVTVMSGGAAVSVDGLHGPLTAMTQGGGLDVSDLTGPLYADTGGGALTARGLSSQTVIVRTGGEETRIGFARPPRTVVVSGDASAITLAVPGGPYAVTTGIYDATTTGALVRVGVPTSPGAPRTLVLDTYDGSITVEPAR